MPRDFHLSVVAPDRSVVEEVVTSMVLPGSEGYFGVMADHVLTIASLKPGLLEYSDSTGVRHYVYLGGGFVEVQGQKVTVLADEASRAHDIDVSEAEKRLDAARRALRGDDSGIPSEDAVLEIERSMSMLRAARSSRN